MARFTSNSKSSDLKKSFLLKLKYSRNHKKEKKAEKSCCPIKKATGTLRNILCCPDSEEPADEVADTSYWPVRVAYEPPNQNLFLGSQGLSLYQMGGTCFQPTLEPAPTPRHKTRSGRVRIHDNKVVVINNYF
ncbi:hypothetical protein EV44_g3117 [Erysiphe necator]|uniref:Uncharacterized protein n=1 Tax=Uncinula necator TaxID=52586 RepID=A0A0B1PFY3_UNCNE|nr:hypothetical protein EV44_g3117 [Erysiphe necator]